MDVDTSSLNNIAGIDRCNKAIALTEHCAAANGIPLQIQYTLPVEQYGLDPNGESVLQNAVANGVTVNSVNIMVFDYYIAGEGVVNMGQAAITRQTTAILSSSPSSRIWPRRRSGTWKGSL